MGFFDSIGNIVSNVGGAVGGAIGAVNPLGAIGGALAGGTAYNAAQGILGGPKAPSAPGEDPKLAAIRNAQLEQAQKFRAGLPQEQEKQAADATAEAKRSLVGQMKQIRTGANSRGLLYSGLKTGAEAGAKAESASGLSKQIAMQNRQLEEQAQALESGAITGNYTPVAQQQQIENINFNNQIRENLARNQAIGNLFGGIGSMGGLLLAQGKS